MVRKIVWTRKANRELLEILQYWINRNQSNSFSIKLNALIEDELNLMLEFPQIGRITDIPNVYIKVIHQYLLYYEISDTHIYVLTIRHGRKNPQTLEIESSS